MSGSVAQVSRGCSSNASWVSSAVHLGRSPMEPQFGVPGFAAEPPAPNTLLPRSQARGGSLAAAFDAKRGAQIIALRGPRDIHVSIVDFVRDNVATLSRCTTPEAVADVLLRNSDTRATQRWFALAATQSPGAIRAQTRSAAMHAGLPPRAIDAVVDGVERGAARLVVDATVRRPLQRAYVEALTKRNARIELTTNDTQALEANDRLIHDLPSSCVDLTRIDPAFTRAHIATETIGLTPREYPFATAVADTLARAAVLDAIANAPAPASHEVALLAGAAKLARETAPDELELLSRGR